jgi:hypothetical protein
MHHLELKKQPGEVVCVTMSEEYGPDLGMVYFLPEKRRGKTLAGIELV